MRTPALLVVAMLALVGCGGHSFTRSDDTAVRRLLGKQQEAWNRGDLPAYMEGYIHADELVFTSGGTVRTGWADTFAKYKERYGSDPSRMGTLVFDILSIQALGGDGAVVLGRWLLTDTAESGGGVFSVVLRRTGVGWRIVHDHTSSDPKPLVPGGPT